MVITSECVDARIPEYLDGDEEVIKLLSAEPHCFPRRCSEHPQESFLLKRLELSSYLRLAFLVSNTLEAQRGKAVGKAARQSVLVIQQVKRKRLDCGIRLPPQDKQYYDNLHL